VKPLSVCVIGNSHAAAIKQAWSNRSPGAAEDATLTFFCAKAQLMRNMALMDGALTPTEPELEKMFRYTSGGHDRIELADYDAFILIGLGFRFSLTQVCDDCGTQAHANWGPVGQLVSTACFRAMIESHLKDNMALQLMAEIRSATGAPILICPTPFRTETDLRENLVRRNPRMTEYDFCASVMDEVEEVGSAMAAEHKGEVVWQDEATVSLPGFTRAEFSVGAVKFSDGDAEAGDADGMHMNEDYGRITLAAALARFGVTSGLGEGTHTQPEAPPPPAELSEKQRRRTAKRENRKRLKRERRRA